MKDPIVEEVRKHRKEHTQKFHGDLPDICADLRRIQEASCHEIVRRKPGKIESKTRSSRPAKARG